jgi:hypothetical protein
MSGAVAGEGLASTNMPLQLSPRGEATAYFAGRGLVSAVSGVAPILGGIFAVSLTARKFELIVRWTNPDGVFAFLRSAGKLGLLFLAGRAAGSYAPPFGRRGNRRDRATGNGQARRRPDPTDHPQLLDYDRLKARTELPANLLRAARIGAGFLRMNGHARR